MYKYNCRKCPIRSRCIDESPNSPGAKVMIRKAFDARTDTLSTWGLLQKSCLLLKAEQEHSSAALSSRLTRAGTVQYSEDFDESESQERTPSALSTRLLKSQQAKEEAKAKTETSDKPKKPVIRRLRPLRKDTDGVTGSEKNAPPPDYLQPVPASKAKGPTKPLKKLKSTGPLSQRELRTAWIIVDGTQRRITLPIDGKIVFGRFDPNVGIPPDIDLNYEDRGEHFISRRHARIIGDKGKHIVEDLGSNSGVFVNGQKLEKEPSQILKPGDEVVLGDLLFQYDMIPESVLNIFDPHSVQHIFTVTPNGRKLVVDPQGELIIGRADPHLTFVPDIDLREDGHIADRVSRRHAVIRWRNGLPFLEDLGSSFGTRLLGEMLPLGKSVPLKPGDHIWLAGCVLAYDVKPQEGDG